MQPIRPVQINPFRKSAKGAFGCSYEYDQERKEDNQSLNAPEIRLLRRIISGINKKN